ncbi:hypothetical protein DXG01_016326 [Tephrocybe rancida]|nr:hypothetical protein DXG01_016326 [Tephrocybe rancida]
MGVEERRKKLMANNPAWGDRLRRSTHVAGGTRENPDETVCDCEVKGASTPAASTILMNNVVAPPPPPVTRISTQGWTLENILKKGKCFKLVPREPHQNATDAIIKFERYGVPLIIDGLHKLPQWPKDDFSPEWLADHGPKKISVRNVHDWTDATMPLNKFLERSRAAPTFAPSEELERLYGKDAECPSKWDQWLHETDVIPASLLPRNNSENLLSSRHVETLMCYLGVGDTFTPCHKDLCASSGQNVMCYTENGGSSFWFMTKSSDAPQAATYFHRLKQELDHETHVITVEQLADAPFVIYVAEQKLGDLVLVPPRSCHQVVNYGGLTIKTSWSRMTLKGLEAAYYHELPIYRRVCRPEIYRVKSTIYHALIATENKLRLSRDSKQSKAVLVSKTETLLSTAKSLLQLFDSILLEESPPRNRKLHCLQLCSPPPLSPGIDDAPPTLVDNLTCDFCGADIFQSFFECLDCVSSEEACSSKPKHGDGFVICAGCYIEGRSCSCGAMDPIQCQPFQNLIKLRDAVEKLLAFNKITVSQLNDVTLASGMGTFRAACVLQELRKNNKKEERTCSTLASGSSHVVASSWVLNCKKCHRGKCFTHILMSQKLHAIDALLINTSDSSHEEHHRHHGRSVEKYEQGRQLFFRAQMRGIKPDITQQRVHLAEQYQICKPINSTFMQAGWYDNHVQITPVITEDTNSSKDFPMSPPLSPLTDLTDLDTPLLSPFEKDKSLPPNGITYSTPLKRKRIVFDYVEVPSAKYKIKLRRVERLVVDGDINPHATLAGVQSANAENSEPPTSNAGTSEQAPITSQDIAQMHPLISESSTANIPGVVALQTRPSTSPVLLTPVPANTATTTPMLASTSTPKSATLKEGSKKTRILPSPTITMPRTSSSSNGSSANKSFFLSKPETSTTTNKKPPEQSSSPANPATAPPSTLAPVRDLRSLPRARKNSRPQRQPAPKTSSLGLSSPSPSSSLETSSAYPRSTSSDTSQLAHAVEQTHSSVKALDSDHPPDAPAPSNSITLQSTQAIAEMNSSELGKQVQDIQNAVHEFIARNPNQSTTLQSVQAIAEVNSSDALGKQVQDIQNTLNEIKAWNPQPPPQMDTLYVALAQALLNNALNNVAAQQPPHYMMAPPTPVWPQAPNIICPRLITMGMQMVVPTQGMAALCFREMKLKRFQGCRIRDLTTLAHIPDEKPLGKSMNSLVTDISIPASHILKVNPLCNIGERKLIKNPQARQIRDDKLFTGMGIAQHHILRKPRMLNFILVGALNSKLVDAGSYHRQANFREEYKRPKDNRNHPYRRPWVPHERSSRPAVNPNGGYRPRDTMEGRRGPMSYNRPRPSRWDRTPEEQARYLRSRSTVQTKQDIVGDVNHKVEGSVVPGDPLHREPSPPSPTLVTDQSSYLLFSASPSPRQDGPSSRSSMQQSEEPEAGQRTPQVYYPAKSAIWEDGYEQPDPDPAAVVNTRAGASGSGFGVDVGVKQPNPPTFGKSYSLD